MNLNGITRTETPAKGRDDERTVQAAGGPRGHAALQAGAAPAVSDGAGRGLRTFGNRMTLGVAPVCGNSGMSRSAH